MTTETTPKATKAAAKAADAVAVNPVLLQWPTDPFGFTIELKQAGIAAANLVGGQDDKHDVLVKTLTLLLKHVLARKESDQESRRLYLERLQANEEARLIMEAQ